MNIVWGGPCTGVDGAVEAQVRGDDGLHQRRGAGAVPQDGAPFGQLLGDAGSQASAAAQVRCPPRWVGKINIQEQQRTTTLKVTVTIGKY